MAAQSLMEWFRVEDKLPIDDFPDQLGVIDLWVAYSYGDDNIGGHFYKQSSYWKSDGWEYSRICGKFTSFFDMGFKVVGWCYLPTFPGWEE